MLFEFRVVDWTENVHYMLLLIWWVFINKLVLAFVTPSWIIIIINIIIINAQSATQRANMIY